jgi:hypothetical protein
MKAIFLAAVFALLAFLAFWQAFKGTGPMLLGRASVVDRIIWGLGGLLFIGCSIGMLVFAR